MLAAFASVDKNNDGTVTREELFQKITERRSGPPSDKKPADAGKDEARPGRPGPDGRGPNAEALFERFDKEHTGSLTKDNVPERVWNRISKADSNSDGKVSKEELQTHLKNVGPRRGSDKPAEPKKDAGPESKPAEQKPADNKPAAQIVPTDVEQAVSALFTEN